MNLRGQVAWEVPPGEQEGLAESGCQMVFISLEVQLFSVGYSEYSGYPSSGYSFAGCVARHVSHIDNA